MFKIDEVTLDYKIRMAGKTRESLASDLGIHRSTLSRRINEGKLTVEDLAGIVKELNLSNQEVFDIFLSPEVA
jgi:transcriptional regulator with XRE-family HTH domain